MLQSTDFLYLFTTRKDILMAAQKNIASTITLVCSFALLSVSSPIAIADDSSNRDSSSNSSNSRPFDSEGKYIPAPINPWPSKYEIEKKNKDSSHDSDIGIPPPVNPYPSNNTGDTSLGGFDPNKDYMKQHKPTKKKAHKKRSGKKASQYSSQKYKKSKNKDHK